jgi:hypothetical protein
MGKLRLLNTSLEPWAEPSNPLQQALWVMLMKFETYSRSSEHILGNNTAWITSWMASHVTNFGIKCAFIPI